MRKSLITGFIALIFTGLHAEVGLNFNAEFLWWKAYPDNQFVNLSQFEGFAFGSPGTRKNFYYSYGWDPGYKVGIDYAFCLDCKELDLFAVWTQFHSSDSIAFNAAITDVISLYSFTGLSLTELTPDSILTYQGHADFCYNRLDIGIAANYFQCNNLSINPSCAFTYLHVKNNINETSNYTTNTNPFSTNVKTAFNGYGVTIGANSHYSLTHGFFIYNKTDLSTLYGQYNASENIGSFGSSTFVTQKTWNIRFVADLEIGVEYFTCLFNCLEVSARIGYEFVFMPDMSIISQIAENINTDNININGVVAGLQIGF